MEKYFHVREKGSTVKIEIMAGLTTFMAMAYILMVNAGMFSDLAEMTGTTPFTSPRQSRQLQELC